MNLNPLVPEIYCSDIKKSLDFYCTILGFFIKYERPEAAFAFLEREGAQLMIEEVNNTDRTWLNGKLEKPFGRGVNFQIAVRDIDALCKIIRDNNIPFFVEPEEKWYRRNNEESGHKQCVIADPDGYLLRFSQHLGIRPLL
jgi:catechol 2,3-dioxygenase-like lactoylglutathione lyase family enzyme